MNNYIVKFVNDNAVSFHKEYNCTIEELKHRISLTGWAVEKVYICNEIKI